MKSTSHKLKENLFGWLALLIAGSAFLLGIYTNNNTAILVVFASGVLIAAAINFHIRSSTLKNLQAREPLGDDEFYSRFYKETQIPKETVLDLIQEIATGLDIPKTQIRPNDKLKDLCFVDIASDDQLDVLAKMASIRSSKLGREVNLQTISTVDDYIRKLG